MVKKVQFKLNSINMFSSGARDNNYFNYVQPYQHTNIFPDLGINMYSFAIYPLEYNPSGIVNFKIISTSVMNITTKGSAFINLFAFSYNILNINQGEIDLVYKY